MAYLGSDCSWANLLVRVGNNLGGYQGGSVTRVSATENIPSAGRIRTSSEEPINASYTRSNISGRNLNPVCSDVMRSSAGWSTITGSTQRTVLRRRGRLLEHQSNDYVTNDSLEQFHLDDFSLGSPQPAAPPNVDSFECEYWERYGIEIGEEGEGGWRDLGQFVSEEVVFGGPGHSAWPHSRAYIEGGIRGEPFRPDLPGSVSGDALVKSTAPSRPRALLLATELLESVSTDLTPTSPTDLDLLDSAVDMLNRFIQVHREAHNKVSSGHTNICPGRRPKSASPSDRGSFFRGAGNQTEEESGDHGLCRYTNAHVITKGSSISKSQVFSAENTETEPIASLTVVPESLAYARKEQARRKGRFGFLAKGSSFNTAAPGFLESSTSGIVSRNPGGVCSDRAVPLMPSRADTKPHATAAGGSILSSSGDDRFSTDAISPVTRMKRPFSPDISYPKSQKIQARRINQKGSKIPVLVKKAGGLRDTVKRPWNVITPIPWNRENSPFNSAVLASSFRRLLSGERSPGERDGSPTMRKIVPRLPNKSMC